MHEQRVALTAGRQTFARAIGPASARTRCARGGAAGTRCDDSLTATMNVSRGESVLLVDGTGAQAQLEQLPGKAFRWPTDPKNVPESVDACEYGLTVLMNACGRPAGRLDDVAAAVEDHGRSVLTTGGNTYLTAA
ncbi:MAG: hypothetical protein ACLS7Z_03710 [Christensenellales bacterium]